MILTQNNKTSRFHSEATSIMAERDMESHGRFLAPLLQPGFHVLDAGCGPGTITNDIAEWVFPGTVTGLDVCSARLRHARRLSQGREQVNTRFIEGSVDAMPFENESFDLVFSHALLEHLQNPARAIREFYRVLRHGGFAVVCYPDSDALQFEPMTSGMKNVLHRCHEIQEEQGGGTKIGASIECWLSETGFSVLSMGRWNEDGHSANRMAKFLGGQLEDAGHPRDAAILREWAVQPGASYRQAWQYTIAIKLGEE